MNSDGCLQKDNSDKYFYLDAQNKLTFGADTCTTKFELEDDMNERTISLKTQDGKFCSTSTHEDMYNSSFAYIIDKNLTCKYDESTKTTIINV